MHLEDGKDDDLDYDTETHDCLLVWLARCTPARMVEQKTGGIVA